MTKQDLISAIVVKSGTTKKDAAAVLEAFLQVVTWSLAKGNKVTLTGFWTFQVSQRSARTWVNPRNPTEKIKIPAMKLPTFRAWKSLKDAVR